MRCASTAASGCWSRGAVAAAVDPLAREALAAAEGSPLVAHLAAAGPSLVEELREELGLDASGLRRLREPLERTAALLSRSVVDAGGERRAPPHVRAAALGPGVPRGAGRARRHRGAGGRRRPRRRERRRSARWGNGSRGRCRRARLDRLVDQGRLAREGGFVVVPEAVRNLWHQCQRFLTPLAHLYPSNGTSRLRPSGMRDHGATSTTRSRWPSPIAGAHLAGGLGGALAAHLLLRPQQLLLVAARLAELGQLERDPLDGAGQLGQLRRQRVAQPPGLAASRRAARPAAPRAAAAQPCGQRQPAHRPRRRARAAQHPLDQHRHRLAQRHLVADRLGEADRLAHRLGRRPRADVRLVLAAGQPPGGDPAGAEAVGDRRQRQRRQLARRRIPSATISSATTRSMPSRSTGSRPRKPAVPRSLISSGRPGRACRAATRAANRPDARAHPAAGGERLGDRLQQPPRAAVQPHQAVAGEQRRPGSTGSTAAPSASSRRTRASAASATAPGSAVTSSDPGQRAIASPTRIPRCTPKAAATALSSPTTGWPPGSGPSATGRRGSGPRSATRSAKRGTRTQTISWWARGIGATQHRRTGVR